MCPHTGLKSSLSSKRKRRSKLYEEGEEENRSCKMSVCEEREEETSVHTERAESPVSSWVSMKSNISMHVPPNLTDGPAVTSDPV